MIHRLFMLGIHSVFWALFNVFMHGARCAATVTFICLIHFILYNIIIYIVHHNYRFSIYIFIIKRCIIIFVWHGVSNKNDTSFYHLIHNYLIDSSEWYFYLSLFSYFYLIFEKYQILHTNNIWLKFVIFCYFLSLFFYLSITISLITTTFYYSIIRFCLFILYKIIHSLNILWYTWI